MDAASLENANPVRLRGATASDAVAILEIEQLSFIHAGERFGLGRILYLLSSGRQLVMVAEIDGRVLGWAVGLVWLRGRSPWGRLYALAVHPEARRKNLGAILLREMIETLGQRGARQIFLEVRPDNLPAVNLYEKHGFAACRALPNYYGAGNPAVRMRRLI